MPEVMEELGKSQRLPNPEPPSPRRSPVKFILLGMLIIALAGGVWAYYHFRDRVSSDDAQVDAHIVAVAPKISGNVIEVLVRDNQPVKAGDVLVRIEAPDFEPAERQLKLLAGAPAKLEVRLVAVPPPSQLRGVVRSLDGKAIGARVRVEPLGTEASVDEKGGFQLDLPPGAYDVVIEATGYVAQRRHVQVEPKGVVILNAELVRAR